MPQAKKILVFCESIASRGGLLRFVNVGHALGTLGHGMHFVALNEQTAPNRFSSFPVLRFEEARSMGWDATMVPGAGFSDETMQRLEAFQDPAFGVRVQHILNDQTFRERFLKVNRLFRPNIVLFNNDDWFPGTYTEFEADRFHTLIGGVDSSRFKPRAQRRHPLQPGHWIIGGLANKNPKVLIDALDVLEDTTLVLFGYDTGGLSDRYASLIAEGRVSLLGRLNQEELVEFYQRVDCVVHTEPFAGWANLVAEAMASGVPVVCTGHGTKSLAFHGESALVLDEISPGAIADAVSILRNDANLCSRLTAKGREIVQNYSWTDYARELLRLIEHDGHLHYAYAPELGLYGKWPNTWRLNGLDALLKLASGASILEFGSAEGTIAFEFLKHEAALVHGFELDAQRVKFANKLCASSPSVFRSTDCSDWDSFLAENNDILLTRYDMVLFLGIYHHLPQQKRGRILSEALRRARDYFAIRTPGQYMREAEIIIDSMGFRLQSQDQSEIDESLGGISVYKREKRNILFTSYPKSGRSWVRYILTNLGVADNFHFHHDHFEFNNGEKPPHDFSLETRLKRYAKGQQIVFLKRNPCDVIVSLYYQVTGRFCDFFQYEKNISEFIRDPYFGATVLRDFYSLWEKLSEERDVYVISYEQLHQNPFQTIKKMLEHCTIFVADEALQNAIDKSSFDAMKKVEQEGNFSQPWLRVRHGHPKVRKGKIGGYKEELSLKDIEYLRSIFGETEFPQDS